MAALIACVYLCLRRGNAFAPDITPPVSLRRWAAALFAAIFLSHVWWLLFYLYSNDIHSVSYVGIAVVDGMSLLITLAGTLLSMLQDRKRPLWPLIVAMIPYMVLLALTPIYSGLLNIVIAYVLLIYACFTIYMVFAVRQYGHWLRDNYADLEHKEVWMSHVLVAVVLLLIISYGFDSGDIVSGYILQILCFVLFAFLLWRVETLPKLEVPQTEEQTEEPAAELPLDTKELQADMKTETKEPKPKLSVKEKQPQPLSSTFISTIDQLLAERCVETKLYLQHDLTAQQLAQAIGTNRSYLSLYFSHKGLTYNAYINDLRINHFTELYRKAAAEGKPVAIAQEMALESGYHSYSTFSLAFKQRMGQTATVWMRDIIFAKTELE